MRVRTSLRRATGRASAGTGSGRTSSRNSSPGWRLAIRRGPMRSRSGSTCTCGPASFHELRVKDVDLEVGEVQIGRASDRHARPHAHAVERRLRGQAEERRLVDEERRARVRREVVDLPIVPAEALGRDREARVVPPALARVVEAVRNTSMFVSATAVSGAVLTTICEANVPLLEVAFFGDDAMGIGALPAYAPDGRPATSWAFTFLPRSILRPGVSSASGVLGCEVGNITGWVAPDEPTLRFAPHGDVQWKRRWHVPGAHSERARRGRDVALALAVGHPIVAVRTPRRHTFGVHRAAARSLLPSASHATQALGGSYRYVACTKRPPLPVAFSATTFCLRIKRVVASGASQWGKCPQCSNHWSFASGNIATARAA